MTLDIRRPRLALGTAFVALALVLGMSASPVQAAAPADRGDQRYRPGAPGVGDEYFPLYGNGGYDVKHYLLNVSYDPPTDRLVGVTTITARATQNLSSFNLDFVGLTVRSIRVNGRAARWTRTDHELTVIPRDGLKKGRPFTAVVRYDGVPITTEIVLGPGFTIPGGFIHTDDGALVAGQPEVAATWFPVNDHPIDKATYTFVVTAPAGLEVVANGRLLDSRRRGATRTWLWHAREPMASYLATVDIGQFDTRTYRTRGLWMHDAIDPDLFDEPADVEDPNSPSRGEVAQGSLGRQGEVLDFLEQWFGRYAFSTGGGIVDDYDELFFALETQTRPVYSKYFFSDSISGDSVVVHELAHQWFGDSVAVREWKHIWLNEGFATYAEWLWSEAEGLGTAQEAFDSFAAIPATDPFWSVVIGDPGPELLFDGAVYYRGAMAVHALRLEVGERDFRRILRAWTATRAGGHGTIPGFIRLAERVSGEQLDDFFEAWLFTGSKPPVLASEAAPTARAQAPEALRQLSAAKRLRR